MHLLDDISDMLAHSRPLDIAIATNDLRVCPRYRWLPLPSRAERLARLAEARERYGWDHGLPGRPVVAKSSISAKGANNPKDTPAPPAKLPGSRSKAMHLLDDISDMLAHSRPLDIAIATNDLRRAERLARLAEARERYGWDHGLPGVPRHLFDQHLADKLADVEAEAG
ncbi:hypothetical protein AHF37_11281 [Paragonimus kellicotti]|nr:hypothetical protein AHF37_11281 [Paragonimus kellicotti]